MKSKYYHYQSLSENKSIEYLENKLEQKVFLTPLNKFNDPYEGQFYYKTSLSSFFLQDLEARKGLLEDERSKGRPNLTDAELCEDLKRYSTRYDLLQHENKKNFIQETFSQWGAICFTNDINNTPMWTYYADNHQGCCIEFELDYSIIQSEFALSEKEMNKYREEIEEGREMILFPAYQKSEQRCYFFKIKYDEKIPTIEHGELLKRRDFDEKHKYILKNSVGYKDKRWLHENEFRLIAHEKNSAQSGLFSLEKFSPFLRVTGVIMGAEFAENEKMKLKKDKIKKLCEKYKVKFYQANFSDKEYKIEIEIENITLHN